MSTFISAEFEATSCVYLNVKPHLFFNHTKMWMKFVRKICTFHGATNVIFGECYAISDGCREFFNGKEEIQWIENAIILQSVAVAFVAFHTVHQV